ncbi:aldehyde dehydrogenase family protein [Streptomyces albiaxialis]|uniref:Aldehyde dehydrogenase family protein n=1 Tax=Streptomyces albiaxialis TaxID=329523 RepID=A0ABN2W4V0_9ACTN
MTISARPHELNFVDGRWVAAMGGTAGPDLNPARPADVIGRFAHSGEDDVEAAVAAADAALPSWRGQGPVRRAERLRALEQVIARRADDFAHAITREQGKLLREARAEVERSLSILRFTAGEGRRLGGATVPAEDARTFSYTLRVPLGVVGLITPWNFPLAIPVWKVAPALLSGCTAVLKPSPLTPLVAALLTEAVAEAGVPPGVLNLVQGDVAAGEALVRHPAVAGVSFTGSLAVGLLIQAGAARRLARTQLELGGKNAVLVLGDADLDAAADAVVQGAFGQAGQRCSATSRVIVEVGVKDALLDRLVHRVNRLKVGPGTGRAVDVGPMISAARRDACLGAVERARGTGAKVLCGGDTVPGDGYFMQPTVLSEVRESAELAQEEIFGPVLSVIDADRFSDAVRIANGVRYGMSGTVFTRDPSRIFEAIEALDVGMLHVNRPGVGAYAHLPHGGGKMSQYGPPECSPHVWEFYTQWRSACIAF